MDETEKEKPTEGEGTEKPTGDGDKPEVPKEIVDANAAAERIEKANAETAKLEKEKVAGEARRRLGGQTEGAVQAKPKEEKSEAEKDAEYADKLERGEVNPMKDDGYIEK